MARHPLSPLAADALAILAASIRVGRLQRRWTAAELAERLGISHVTVARIESASPGVAVGTVLEAAALVGVPLFDADPVVVARYRAQRSAELALLPEAARPLRTVNDDF